MTVTVDMLGIKFEALDLTEFFDRCCGLVGSREKSIIGYHNVNSIRLYRLDAKFRMFYDRASLTYADGMPLIFMARLLGHRVRRSNRLAYNQFIYDFARLAERRNWRIFFFGSRPGVGEAAFTRVRAISPNLVYRARHGYFQGAEASAAMIREIEEFRPHVLMVGLGAPRQEHWVIDHFELLPHCLIMNVGACMDFLAGVVPVAPAWMSRNGLEWLYRLVHEPRRLARRYLVESWLVIGLFIRELVGRALFRTE